MGIKIRNYFPSKVRLDDEESGESKLVTIHVKRLNQSEYAKFKADYNRVSEPPSNKMIARLPDGEEQERDEHGNFKISDAEISERRIREMDAATRATYDQLDAEDEAFAEEFLFGSIRDYVTVPEGEIDWEGNPIRTGDELVEAYYARLDVIQHVVRAVWQENTLSAAQKKALRSLSDFQHSLNARTLEVAGPKPVATVESVAAPVSAPAEDATESTAALSGSEVQS